MCPVFLRLLNLSHSISDVYFLYALYTRCFLRIRLFMLVVNHETSQLFAGFLRDMFYDHFYLPIFIRRTLIVDKEGLM